MDINNVWNVLRDHAGHINSKMNARDAASMILRNAKPTLAQDKREWYSSTRADGTAIISAFGVSVSFAVKKEGGKWTVEKVR